MWAAAATIAFELLTKSMVFFLMSVLKKLYTHFLMWKKYWNMPKILAKNDEKKISSTFNLFQKLVSLWSHSTIPSKHKSIIFFRYSLLGGEWNFHPFGINFWVTFRPYNSAMPCIASWSSWDWDLGIIIRHVRQITVLLCITQVTMGFKKCWK